MSVERLHPGLQHHIVSTLGWAQLRPLQEAAVEPLLAGHDALLLAPTAGGKTEAAVFPLLSRMANEHWTGLSVLYVCPLRALLNNLEPRLSAYASWLGRRAALWHGDVGAGVRQRLLTDPADLLLTTPESIEAMLVSTKITPREHFAHLRAVVVDEVHAFAGDDRGWHLLAVLERLSRLAGRPLQRVGLSATIGNPPELLQWLRGSNRERRPAVVVDPPAPAAGPPDLQLDYVGSVENAATVVAALHRGEKRLVFADSRRTVEAMAVSLRSRGVQTFVSHSSLARDERRRAEQAFSEARDCVIVATSTLELGVDVGDLDRVIQLGAPRTVASFLQRLGRTGRRPGATRNTLFLATDEDELLQGAGLLRLAGERYVEPVVPPPVPFHVLAQQLLALTLQEGRVGDAVWADWLSGSLPSDAEHRGAIAAWLTGSEHLDSEGGMFFIGPATEQRYGRKHFLELLSVFTADPQFTVLAGRTEIGTVDPMVLTRKVAGPRVLALAGRSWLVGHVEWRRRRVFVEPTELPGSVRWFGLPQPLSFALTDAMRRVVLDGELPGVRPSQRAERVLGQVRDQSAHLVDASGSVVVQNSDGPRWWTWAGARANAVLTRALADTVPGVVEDADRLDNRYVRLNTGAGAGDLRSALRAVRERHAEGLAGVVPHVSDQALRHLKFSELLPPELARTTLASRLSDASGAEVVVTKPVGSVSWPGST